MFHPQYKAFDKLAITGIVIFTISVLSIFVAGFNLDHPTIIGLAIGGVLVGLGFFIGGIIEKNMFKKYFGDNKNWLLHFKYKDNTRVIITIKGIFFKLNKEDKTKTQFTLEDPEYGLENIKSLIEGDDRNRNASF